MKKFIVEWILTNLFLWKQKKFSNDAIKIFDNINLIKYLNDYYNG